MEIKVSFTPEERELIKTVQTKSYCERIGCRDMAFCGGCPEQVKWEREVREIKKSPLWEYAVEYNNYLDRVKEHKALEQKRKRLIGISRGTGLGRESIIKRLVNKLRRKGGH